MSAGVAALPMYARPELQPALEDLWQAIRDGLRRRGVDAPERLCEPDEELTRFWMRDDLLLSQTCGYPYRHLLKDRVTLVGTPDYGLTGCAPGYYHSVIVVRGDDARRGPEAFDGATVAINDLQSQSGFAAPMVWAARTGIRFGRRVLSGAHTASARMVQAGAADIAALDAVSWRRMQAFDPWAADLRILDRTEATPGLPFITAFAALADPLREAISEAIAAMPGDSRTLLSLRGLCAIGRDSYLAVADDPVEPSLGA